MNRLTLKTKILMPLSMIVGLFILPSLAQAGVMGGSLIVQNTGDVHITFKGSSAGYTSNLSFGGTHLFSNRDNAGTSINLGSFAAGTELNFNLLVTNTNTTFFSGMVPNPDGHAHTMLTGLGNGSTQVGWEDLWGGGDEDYNDLVFELTNTAIGDYPGEGDYPGQGDNPGQGKLIANPEPSTIILFGSGLLGLGAWRLRKKQA